MRAIILLFGVFLFVACGGVISTSEHDASSRDRDAADDAPDAADDAPAVIVTTEACKVDGDCKMDPGVAFCREKTAVRYEIATCGADQRCVWSRLENRCDLRCEDGYCISSAVR